MAESQGAKDQAHTTMLDRIVGSLPTQYREEVARMANRIRDRLPPIMVEHRVDALEHHLDARLDQIEKRLEEIVQQLGKR